MLIVLIKVSEVMLMEDVNQKSMNSSQPNLKLDYTRVPIQLLTINDPNNGLRCLGGTINDYHFNNFMKLDARMKLRKIREWLCEMYGDEFSRNGICNSLPEGISYQGLIDIEEMNNRRTRTKNIVYLSKHYGVDERYILSVELQDDLLPAIYIGKEEDKEEYFAAYYALEGTKHILDQFCYDEGFMKNLGDSDYKVNELTNHYRIRLRMFIENDAQMQGIEEYDELYLTEAELKLLNELLTKQVEMMKAQIKLRKALDKENQ